LAIPLPGPFAPNNSFSETGTGNVFCAILPKSFCCCSLRPFRARSICERSRSERVPRSRLVS